MPKIVGKSSTVVEFEGLRIDELAGNVASKEDTLSVARVVISEPCSEPWLTLDYDEWICMLKGSMEVLYGDDEKLTVNAGETLFVAKGERFRPVFPQGGTEYIPVCVPAFKPERCHREEDGVSDVSKKLKDLHSNGIAASCSTTSGGSNGDDVDQLYHMCRKSAWEAATKLGEAYFPPTFDADGGFTHATAVADRLIETANHFYTATEGDWICLQINKEALKKVGIVTRFEEAKPVGGAATGAGWADWLCPHIFGGIPTQIEGVVTKIYPMQRNDSGIFLSIEGI